MSKAITNIIFDLDGTLVDSLNGIESSARHASAECLPERAVSSLRDLVGPPIAKMFAQLWPDLSSVKLEELVAAFRRHYDEEGSLLSEPYPLVRETLIELERNGIGMFVLTNKPFLASQSILRNLDLSRFFRDLISPDLPAQTFSVKREGAAFLRQKYDLEPAATAVMGDGQDDLEAAEFCGFQFIRAAYGYGSLVHNPAASPGRSANTFSQLLSHVL